MPQYLPKGEFDALKNRSQNKQTVIQKSEKCNYIVIVDRKVCWKYEEIFKWSKLISENFFKRWQFFEFYYQPRETHW